jgi:SAM-dependent methyltransferase
VREDRRRVASKIWHADLSDEDRDQAAATLQDLADDPFLREVAARSLQLMELGTGAHVLDVGCGSGVLLPAMSSLVGRSGRVVGLDYAPAMLQLASERLMAGGLADSVELVLGNADALPFPDATFDAVHVERVLMHLEDPDAAIREMRRVARPGGRIVAAEPDSGGVRVDHPLDPEGFALISLRDLQQFRQGSIGLELNRRFAEAGIVDRTIVPLTAFVGDYDEVMADGDRIAAKELVAEGVLAPERAAAALKYLHEASARGEFSWLGTMVIAIGRAPGTAEVPRV